VPGRRRRDAGQEAQHRCDRSHATARPRAVR
jgi:hypothetical protein